MTLERSILGRVVETKDANVNGIPYGVVKGYIATWTPDARNGLYGVQDRIMPGAYAASIQEHKDRNNRQVRLKDQHYRVIGGFPIDTVKEDSTGLYGEGQINLDTQLGREAYSLAKQGVLVDFSVGHIVQTEELKNGYRNIIKAQLIEGSIVDEPANQRANILEVKSSRSDLEILSDANYKWDAVAARERIMEMKYAQGNPVDAFIGGQLIGDLIEGKLFAIPQAIQEAAKEIKSTSDQLVIERYYARMGIKSPFEKKMFFTLDDVKDLNKAELKELLLSSGIFSNGAVRAVIARIDGPAGHETSTKTLAEEIRAYARSLTNN